MIDYVEDKCKHHKSCNKKWQNADGGFWCFGCDKNKPVTKKKSKKIKVSTQ